MTLVDVQKPPARSTSPAELRTRYERVAKDLGPRLDLIEKTLNDMIEGTISRQPLDAWE